MEAEEAGADSSAQVTHVSPDTDIFQLTQPKLLRSPFARPAHAPSGPGLLAHRAPSSKTRQLESIVADYVKAFAAADLAGLGLLLGPDLDFRRLGVGGREEVAVRGRVEALDALREGASDGGAGLRR